jgi:hypothetical protein
LVIILSVLHRFKLLILPLFGHYIVCPSSIKAPDSAFVWSLYCQAESEALIDEGQTI